MRDFWDESIYSLLSTVISTWKDPLTFLDKIPKWHCFRTSRHLTPKKIQISCRVLKRAILAIFQNGLGWLYYFCTINLFIYPQTTYILMPNDHFCFQWKKMWLIKSWYQLAPSNWYLTYTKINKPWTFLFKTWSGKSGFFGRCSVAIWIVVS